LIVERDEQKALKKKYAEQLIHREEFVTRQMELRRLAEQNITAMKNENARSRGEAFAKT
jgi:ribosomal protein L17